MFPQPAKEFLEWRKAGGGPERELVAAVIGALAIGEQKAPAPAAAAPGAAPAADGTPAWRSFGRMRQMR